MDYYGEKIKLVEKDGIFKSTLPNKKGSTYYRKDGHKRLNEGTFNEILQHPDYLGIIYRQKKKPMRFSLVEKTLTSYYEQAFDNIFLSKITLYESLHAYFQNSTYGLDNLLKTDLSYYTLAELMNYIKMLILYYICKEIGLTINNYFIEENIQNIIDDKGRIKSELITLIMGKIKDQYIQQLFMKEKASAINLLLFAKHKIGVDVYDITREYDSLNYNYVLEHYPYDLITYFENTPHLSTVIIDSLTRQTIYILKKISTLGIFCFDIKLENSVVKINDSNKKDPITLRFIDTDSDFCQKDQFGKKGSNQAITKNLRKLGLTKKYDYHNLMYQFMLIIFAKHLYEINRNYLYNICRQTIQLDTTILAILIQQNIGLNYWSNSSFNDIIYHYFKTDFETVIQQIMFFDKKSEAAANSHSTKLATKKRIRKQPQRFTFHKK